MIERANRARCPTTVALALLLVLPREECVLRS